MNKETIPVADFQRKAYAKPQIRVVEIEKTIIICSSQTESYQDGDTADWY